MFQIEEPRKKRVGKYIWKHSLPPQPFHHYTSLYNLGFTIYDFVHNFCLDCFFFRSRDGL